jgi:thioredoxin reductase (NADPH)
VTEPDPAAATELTDDLFAVGDVRAGSVKRVAAAVGEGSTAIRWVQPHLSALV